MSERLFDIDAVAPESEARSAHLESELRQRYADWEPEANPPGEKLEIVIDEQRTDEVLGTLLNAYADRQYPYSLDRVRLPHDPRHMPESLERGTVDHAMFLFSSCYYMRGGEKSVNAFKKLSVMYESHPELFHCQVAAAASEADILAALKSSGLGMHKVVPRQWKENAWRLQERYDGDPRKIFDGVADYDEALRRIKNHGKEEGFIGFQEKMTSMIIYYLMDEGLIEPFRFPIPVDMHVMRVSIANELIKFPNAPDKTELFTEEVRAALRKLYFDYAERHDVDPLRLCDAVWLLSESLCGRYPGNVTFEPFGRNNRNGRSTVLIPQEVDVSDPRQQAAYEESCRNCPLNNTCEHSVPGKPTYVAGSIYIRGRRVRFPLPAQGVLFENRQD